MLERVQRRQETISRKLEKVGKSNGDEESDCKIRQIPSCDNNGNQYLQIILRLYV